MIYINKDWQLIIIIIIFKKSALQGWKTADAFYQSEYPKPHEANSKKELGKRKRENSRRQKGREQLTPTKSIGPALKIHIAFPHHRTRYHQDRSIEIPNEVLIKVLRYCKVLQARPTKYYSNSISFPKDHTTH